jgi:hypothetical protein
MIGIFNVGDLVEDRLCGDIGVIILKRDNMLGKHKPKVYNVLYFNGSVRSLLANHLFKIS